jgi:hypothetical protein
MPNKPVNEAPRIEAASEPAPKGDSNHFRIKCTHAIDGTFAGWLDYSGPGNWVWLSGPENPPGGMIFYDYYYGGARYLVPSGVYPGDDRYLGLNSTSGNTRAAWNLWARASAIDWDGTHYINSHDNPQQHLIDAGDGYVNWDTRTDTALNCQRVAV